MRASLTVCGVLLALCAAAGDVSFTGEVNQSPEDAAATEVSVRIVSMGDRAVTVEFTGIPIPGGRIDAVIKDLDGNDLGFTSGLYGGARATVAIPARLDREHISKYTLYYRYYPEGSTDAQELAFKKKSLFFLADKLETIVLGSRDYLSGTRAALRIIVSNRSQNEPVGGAEVRVTYEKDGKEAVLVSGRTDGNGTLDAGFILPDMEGKLPIKVAVSSPIGADTVNETINLKKGYRILLTTDKPIYQPGQTVHLRSLSLQGSDSKPLSSKDVTLEVLDAKGNKVFKKAGLTDGFGIFSIDFALASELNLGRYTAKALMGNDAQEKTFTVERYVLPKFKVALTSERNFFEPGEVMKADVQSDYFFDKPVSGGTLTLSFSKFDVEFEEFAKVTAALDENGHYSFEQKLPSHFVGQPLEQGKAFVKVEAAITDRAEHTETLTKTFTVCTSPVIVAAVPEGGDLIPDIENQVFLVTTYADGTPVAADISVTADAAGDSFHAESLRTDEGGFGVVKILPGSEQVSLHVSGKTAKGERFQGSFDFTPRKTGTQSIIVRSDRALYTAGESMALEILSNRRSGTAYIDLIRAGQTMLTKTVDLAQGKARLSLSLDETLAGTVAVSAYMIAPNGDIIRDRKLMLVSPADELDIAVTADRDTYAPAGECTVTFRVTNKRRNGVPVALGVMVVDESVFALTEMQPGMEKIYFYLEQELSKPRYEIHGYDIKEVLIQKGQDENRQMAAKVLLASAAEAKEPAIKVNTYEDTGRGMQYQQEVSSALIKRIEKIRKAIDKFKRAHEGFIQSFLQKTTWDGNKPITLAMLAEGGFLSKADIQDFWGNALELEGNWCAGCKNYHDFTLLSYGPDGVKGTQDDVPAKRRQAEREFGLRRAAGLGGMEMIKEGFQMKMANGREMDAAAVAMPVEAEAAPAGAEAAAEPPRIRKYFPETLYFNPALITDGHGNVTTTIPLADSITTWRLSAFASSLAGALGSTTSGIRVFQDFFVDIDFPVALTQNDEVSVPVAVYNYLTSPQKVRIEVKNEDWFTLDASPQKEVSLKAGEVSVCYFPMKVQKIGHHKFTVFGYGEKVSDAVSRGIDVLPDGEEQVTSHSGRLENSVEKSVDIPAGAIPGASTIFVKIYPGIFSQVLEGMDSILRMPFGCFEQTSSVTYPNILVLDYMKATGKVTPEIQMKAEGLINTGYQRLLSYEVEGGGFEWFGKAPAHNILTSYGLMEFHDMSKVYEIDPNVMTRTQEWLARQQAADGSWKPSEGGIAEGAINKFQNDVLRNTAYTLWALSSTGYEGQAVTRAAGYLAGHLDEIKDSYTLALCANAFVRHDAGSPVTARLVNSLVEKAEREGDTVYWKTQEKTSTYGCGDSAGIETTALACQAIVRYGKHPDIVSGINNYLIKKKDSGGTWHSTQATIQALKALLSSVREATQEVNGTISVSMNGKEAQSVTIDRSNSDVLQLIDLKHLTGDGENRLKLSLKGKGSMLYQIVGRYYTPWRERVHHEEPMSIRVTYDRTSLAVNTIVKATAAVKNNRPAAAKMVIVDLGIPPGFEVIVPDFQKLVEDGKIEKYSLTGREIIVYLREVPGNAELELDYSLRAKYPVRAKTPAASAYEYYDPGVRAESAPQELVVLGVVPNPEL